MNLFRRLLLAFAALAGGAATALAFNGHVVTEGPLKLTLSDIPTVTAFDTPQACTATFANSGNIPLAVTAQLTGLVDTCRAVGETTRQLTIPAKGQLTATFQFACGPGTYSAHYPLHVRASFNPGGQPLTAVAIQVFQTDFSALQLAQAKSAELPVHAVPAAGAFALASLKTQRIAWSYLGQPAATLPVGWTGSDAASGTNFARTSVARGGVSRSTLTLHPPYRPRAGTALIEQRLKLPTSTPIRLNFFNAIRDSTPQEGKSDGVTFRVWVGEQKLFEQHTDAKTWTPGEADLSAFAGREIILRLESHPGPKNNTTCDSSYWGDPVITVGAPPPQLTAEAKAALVTRARALLDGSASAAADSRVYALEGDCRAAFVLGPNGLADGVIAFGDARRQLLFDGLHLALRDHVVGAWPSAAIVESVRLDRNATGADQIIHRVRVADATLTLTLTAWAEGPALRLKVESADAITGLGLSPADQRALRVYYGHGYCIVDPTAFRATAGGHNLSTSHVGFDFAGGVSLLTASDTPPDHLQVDPARRLYQLHTHPDATLTFVPGFAGALDCAIRYRPLSDKVAAAGVTKKVGRFVFDLWGGRYADHTKRLSRCLDYGLTNSLAVIHTWQRWGYDYRLPDVFPPLPSLGTLEELREFGRFCTSRGVLWGLHDNYIDLYPDATGFSYDHITFTPDGKPRRAWLNEGRDAQSYQFRPDRIQPFLTRNLDLYVPALHPTASFVDVFSSINTFDFYDRTGRFHSKRETQRAWGEAFASIRDACGDHAPTISEAGSDHLIGWLDGADAQFMQLGSKSERFHNVVSARDWDRVPWFDAVHHTRFSLHGVGYSDRYQGGASREEHGIESDDYLSAELLTGHALMIDAPGGVRGAVRKYWLAQDFIASIARDDIYRVEFAGGDIHRLIVTWRSGARVWINRGDTDWEVADRTLPQFGFLALNGDIECSVERFGDAIAERARSPGKSYFNSRVFNPAAPLALTPVAEQLDYLGGRRFRLVSSWAVDRPVPKDYAITYYFSRTTPGRRALTEFAGGGTPAVPTSQWRRRITVGADWTITMPDDLPLGGYEILVTLHDPRNRNARQRLLGDEDNRRRYSLGKIVVESTDKKTVSNIRLVPPVSPVVPSARFVANTRAVDFSATKTTGAFRCELAASQIILTPLPDGDPFPVTLRLERLLGRPATVAGIERLDAKGTPLGDVPFTAHGDEITFTTANNVFAYRLSLR
ncbi:MAG: hypothetical protein HZA93_20170 [Verrucomicrobia bacterium]|nr:hypothetical protein [Verrucomicrobiota bacterium]